VTHAHTQRIKILCPAASHSPDPHGMALQSGVAGHVGDDMPAPASRARDRMLRGHRVLLMLPWSSDNAVLTPSSASSTGRERRGSRATCRGELTKAHMDFVSFTQQGKMQLLAMMLDPTGV